MTLLGSRLTTQIQLAAVALVVVAAGALVYVLDRHQRDTQLIHLGAGLEDGVRLNGTRLNQTVATLRQDVLFLSKTPPVSGIVRATLNGGIDRRDNTSRAAWVKRLQEIFAAFATAHPNYFLIRYIGVADGGRELVRIERRDGRLSVVADADLAAKGGRDFFPATVSLPEGDIYLSDFGLDRFEQQLPAPRLRVLRAATPVYGASGEIFGLVMVNLDAGPILDAIGTGLPEDAHAYMADQVGRYLVHPEAARAFDFEAAGRLGRDFPGLEEAFGGGDRLALRPLATANGPQYVTAERIRFDPRRPERFVQLAYAASQSAVGKQIAATRHEAAVGGLLATLLVAGVLLLFVKRLLSPLHRVAAAAAAIAAGERDVVLPQTASGDIGALTEALRHMLEKVAARERDFLRLNADLEQRVKERTAQLRLAASVFENTSEGVVVTDDQAHIVSVNAAFTEITGYEAAEAIGRKPNLLRSDHHDAGFYRIMWDALLATGRWQGEIWNRRKSGEAYLEWLTINRIPEADGIPASYVSVFNDITEQRRKDEHIRHLAFHDPLTALPNRALLQDRLRHAIERARREDGRLAVIFIDLDRFKVINDTLGHDVGDMLLQEVAVRIKSQLRGMDTVARMGGDEFVVLIEDLREAEHCATLAGAIIADIARPLEIQGNAIQAGASLGIAFFPADGDDALELMKHADTAMYAAKAEGKGTYRFFQAAMMEETLRRLKLETELRHAIAGGGLVLHYQPKVSLASGEVLGVEALVRWRHPELGLVPPDAFISVAEECGLIVPLGDWVLNEACRQAAAWQAQGLTPTIAVNISAKQLQQDSLVEQIAALTEHHGIPPSRLQVELTESVLMADPEKVSDMLVRLREIGVTVAVDDFGTGYSSLSYLRRLPIDVLKIDRSFVMNADQNEEDAQIVRTIVALGHALKLDIVAEG
ncbi:MAG: hypothetical protein A2045_06350, partial [Rhodocyclales bacterium GWA2_65_20]